MAAVAAGMQTGRCLMVEMYFPTMQGVIGGATTSTNQRERKMATFVLPGLAIIKMFAGLLPKILRSGKPFFHFTNGQRYVVIDFYGGQVQVILIQRGMWLV